MGNNLRIQNGELLTEDLDNTLHLLDMEFQTDGAVWNDITYNGGGEIIQHVYRKGGAGGEIIATKVYTYADPFPSGYANGTDGSLNNPDDAYSNLSEFCPMDGTGDQDSNLEIGTYQWYIDNAVGASVDYYGFNVGSAYGTVKFTTSSNWNSFASAGLNGVQTINLPRLAHSDDLGGSFNLYFHASAFSVAFNGNTSDAIITQDGSVFKGSVSNANLVVTGSGSLGQAGGGSAIFGDNLIQETLTIGIAVYTLNYVYDGNDDIIDVQVLKS